MSKNPVRQHHVPQTYLKNFSFQKREQFKTYTLDMKTRKIFEANIKDIAVEKDFYTVNLCANKYAWENFYATHIEPMMGASVKRLIQQVTNNLVQDNAYIINQECKMSLSIIITFQLLRCLKARDYLLTIAPDIEENVLDKIKELFMGKGDEKLDNQLKNYKISDDLRRWSFMSGTLNEELISKIVTLLSNRYWCIYRITGKGHFISSDNPVMFLNYRTGNVGFGEGLENSCVYYPISSKLLVAVYPKEFIYEGCKIIDGRLIFINEKDVNGFNLKHVRQCDRQCFCSKKETLQYLLNQQE